MKKIVLLLSLIPMIGAAQTYEIDPNFMSGSGFQDEVISIEIDENGRYVAAGFFSDFDGTTRHKLARLNVDGTLDLTFDPGTTFENETVTAMELDPGTGQIYVATFDQDVVRINGDGSIDATFVFDNTGFDGPVNAMAIDAEGKLIAGQGPGSTGVSAYFGRYNTDGTADATFESKTALGKFPSNANIINSTRINDILIDSEGRIMVVGNFTSFGAGEEGIARLNTDGTTDNTFNLNFLQEVSNFEKFSIAIQDNGQILIGGLRGTGTDVERFNADGSRELTFFSASSGGLLLRPTNKIYTSGTDDLIIGGRYGILSKGFETGFDVEIEAGDGFLTNSEIVVPEVLDFEVDAEGRILAVGTFNYYNGTSQGFIVRLQQCASIELTTDLSENTSACIGEVKELTVEATGTELTYQWEVKTSTVYGSVFSPIADDATYSGSATNTLSINGFDASFGAYEYRCIISDANCSITSTWTDFNVFDGQSINIQPENQEVCVGETVFFSMDISGSAQDIQWQVDSLLGNGFEDLRSNGIVVSGANATVLSINNVVPEMDGFVYRAVLSSCNTPVLSEEVLLQVLELPVISGITSNEGICVSGDAAFTVEAEGSGPLSYQWQYRTQPGSPVVFEDILDGGGISGAQTATLSLTGVDSSLDILYLTGGEAGTGQFRCIVSSSACDEISSFAILQIYATPSINIQPIEPEPLCDTGTGVSTSFSVQVTDGSRQWQVDNGSGFEDIVDDDIYSGANSSVLNLTDAPASFDGNIYRAIIGNCSTPVISDEVTLTINERPVITFPVIRQDICEGGDATFSVEATGENLTYQWQENISGLYVDIVNNDTYFASGATLQITAAGLNLDNRLHRVVVSSAEGCFVNSQASLQVFAAPSFSGTIQDRTACEGEEIQISSTFPSNFSALNSLQWQQAMAGSDIFTDIVDDSQFTGITSSQLIVLSPTISMNGSRFRLKVVGCQQEIVSSESTLTVLGDPIVTTSPQPQTVCLNEAVSFSVEAFGGEDLQYLWMVSNDAGETFGQVSGFSGQGTSTITRAGGFTDAALNGAIYKCVVSQPSPCGARVAESFEALLAFNEATIINQTVGNTICVGEAAVFEVEAVGQVQSYQWQEGGEDLEEGGRYSGVNTPILTVGDVSFSFLQEANRTYRCVITSECGETSTSNMQINLNGVSKPAVELAELTSEGALLMANFTGSTTEPTRYDWFLDQELLTSGQSLRTLLVDQAGSYTVIVTNASDCPSYESEPFVYDGSILLSTEEPSRISLYPNPATDRITVEGIQGATYQIYSLDGKLNLSGMISNGGSISIESLQSGQYLIQMIENDKVVHSDKILKIN